VIRRAFDSLGHPVARLSEWQLRISLWLPFLKERAFADLSRSRAASAIGGQPKDGKKLFLTFI